MALLTTERLRTRLSTSPAALRARFESGVSTTPGRLTLYLVVLALLGALTGLSALVGVAQRGDLVDEVAARSGPLTVQAQELYRSLSDADATAATAFLTSAAEPPALRQRYQADIAAASAALAATSATTDAERDPVARIAAALPVYTGLIETARTQNRLNLPVGAAYLREASALMRGTLLPAAQDLYQVETDRLAADRESASSFPWLTTLLILLTLGALVVVSRYLALRTSRLINIGLAVATAAGLVLLLWVFASWAVVSASLHASERDGSAQVEILAQARIAALQARADEALTLVARGSGGEFEEDFAAKMTLLAGPDGQGGLLQQARDAATDPEVRSTLAQAAQDVTAWRTAHRTLRGLDDGGQYPEAVALAVGDKGPSASFGELDGELKSAISRTGAAFADNAASARGALTATTIGWLALVIVLIAGVIVGLQRRIGEYR